MIDLMSVIEKMVMLLLMIAAGYLANKTKIMDETSNQKISSLVVNITAPLLILSAVVGGTTGTKSEAIFVLFLAFALYAGLGIISLLIPKLFRVAPNQKGLIRFMTIFPNVGFMGFPVIQAVFGKEALFFASLFNLAFNILVYTYGVHLIQMDIDGPKEAKKGQWKKLINPGTVGALLALAIFLLDIKLPTVLADTCTTIGNVTTPLAMLVIGSTMACVPPREVFLDAKVYLFSILKTIVLPAIIWILCRPILKNPLILGILVIISAMPCANIGVMFSIEYGADTKMATKYVVLSTLVSFISIPILTYLLSM